MIEDFNDHVQVFYSFNFFLLYIKYFLKTENNGKKIFFVNRKDHNGNSLFLKNLLNEFGDLGGFDKIL